MTLFSEEALNRRRSLGPDNCGRVLDAGSDGKSQTIREMRAKTENRDCYLYDGTGNPWAGHSNVIAPPRAILNACKSANDENFGRVLATGSKGDTKKNMTEDTSIRTGQMIASFIALFFIWIISLISSRASIRVRVQPTDALEIPKFLYLKAGTGNA